MKNVVIKTEQTYWCVSKTVYADGTSKISMFGRDCEEKPNDTQTSNPGKDLSKFWFHTKEEADAFFHRIKPLRPPVPLSHEKEPDKLSVVEAADYIHMSKSTLHGYIRRGEISCIRRPHGKILIKKIVLDEYLNANEIPANKTPGNKRG